LENICNKTFILQDSIHASPITLRVDPNGYVIYWQEPNRVSIHFSKPV